MFGSSSVKDETGSVGLQVWVYVCLLTSEHAHTHTHTAFLHILAQPLCFGNFQKVYKYEHSKPQNEMGLG